jgi:ribose transport system substrate-binding protein
MTYVKRLCRGNQAHSVRRLYLTVAASVILFPLAGLAIPSKARAASDKPLTIGYSTYTVANPAFAGIVHVLKVESAKYHYKLLITNSNGSASQQINDVETLLDEGVDYVIITPADGTAISPVVAAAQHDNVPTIAFVDHIAAPVTATYSMDHTQGGQMAAEEIVKFLTKKNGAPKGNVVDLEGIAGIVAAAQREKGFADVIAKYPDIKVVARADGGFDIDHANQAMSAILQAQPKIDAVYGANDAETFGAIQAMKAAGRFAPVGQPGHIYAIGVDGSAPGIQGIRDGSQDATVSQQFIKMGVVMMDNIHATANGTLKTLPSVVWPLMVIDRSNINSDAVEAYGIWADQVK